MVKKSNSSNCVFDIGFDDCLGGFLQSRTIGFDRIFQFDRLSDGLVDDYSTFRRVYETPIIRSREPGCSEKDAKLGESRSAQVLLYPSVLLAELDACRLATCHISQLRSSTRRKHPEKFLATQM